MSLLVLGTGEIARRLVAMATLVEGLAITVAESDVADHSWPEGVEQVARNWPDAPWKLGPGTHAVILRGHDRDNESLQTLLEHGAEHVYLVASARRADWVLRAAGGLSGDRDRLERISAPAGLDLGGQDSGAIALSLLAEIQWRMQGGQGRQVLTMAASRAQRIEVSRTGQRDQGCPGQRG
ncbi:MAG: XdhC family protein [Halothiobacillaceae bacterium]